MPKHNVYITGLDGEQQLIIAEHGRELRQVLRDAGQSPYVALTEKRNCGGRGICATCGVWIEEAIAARHWHDKLAKYYGYPRLSCQITVDRDLRVQIPSKIIWGKGF